MAQYRRDTHKYLDDNKTLFEVVMLCDEYGNPTGGGTPSGVALDAFGRIRQSTPFTLFDSYNRYQENDKFTTLTQNGGMTTFHRNSSSVLLSTNGSAGSSVTKETKRVFAYQPGKSLQILNTFVMAPHVPGLVQRIGYFNDTNGIFIERNNNGVNFVRRSNVTDTIIDTKVVQENWNIDPLDGTGISGHTLDITKSHIFWMDIEWLGVGSVRCGFVIDGQLIHCHTFNHANTLNLPYMTTAILPVRYHIENTTAGIASSMRQICTSVISEGGYELRGRGKYATTGVLPADLRTVSTAAYTPILSVRLKTGAIDRTDALAILSEATMVSDSSANFDIAIIQGGTLTGAVWTSTTGSTSIEYDKSATAITGGTPIIGKVMGVSNQSSSSMGIGGELFDLQFERNGLTKESYAFTLAAKCSSNNVKVGASLEWQEIT